VRPGRAGAGASAADPDRLQALYAATQELMAARTREALCDAVVATAESVLELPHVAVHFASDGRLAPVATTTVAAERFDGEPPVYGRTHPLWEHRRRDTARRRDGRLGRTRRGRRRGAGG